MPRFEKNDDCLELKSFLKIILSDNNVGMVLDNIVNDNGDELWNYVVGYKLIAHNLERLRINDPELAFLVGEFLGNYHAIESLHKKYVEKNQKDEKLEELIGSSTYAVDLLTDIYRKTALSTKTITTKYKEEDINHMLDIMTKEKVLNLLELEKETYYTLSDHSRVYMRDRYFKAEAIEEQKQKRESDNIRSKVLHIVREKNKEEMD